MSNPGHEEEQAGEGVRVSDKRRIDPETFEVRESAARNEALAAEDAAASALEGDVAGVEAKVAELTADLQRVHAEYANYRKRVERDRVVVQEMAVAGAINELLPVLDDIERAREHGELEGAFRTVGEAFEAALTKLGLERFGASGEEFDPTVHEALTSEENDAVSVPTVTTVYQPGYRFAGRVLRPARVAVAGT
ncbi:MAG TPA: nucleotide exchange factor GrpE [Candidatus Nanopelagicales bacterium]|nr:nucleotide exchange factor GrpE [Candidatus Nanopelagicales bacterium]